MNPLICLFDGKHLDDHTPEELDKCIADAAALTSWPQRVASMLTDEDEVT